MAVSEESPGRLARVPAGRGGRRRAVRLVRVVVGLVLPSGFSFNTDGTAIYMTLSVLFMAQALDIHLSFGQQLSMLFVMLFTAKGAAGFTGAGFVALAATLPAAGVIPAGALALVLGIDRFMAEIRAVTNLFSNIFATVVVAKWMNELDEVRADAVLDGDLPIEDSVLAREVSNSAD